MNSNSQRFRFIQIEKLGLDSFLLMAQIKPEFIGPIFNPFLSKIQNVFPIGSETDFGMALIRSD